MSKYKNITGGNYKSNNKNVLTDRPLVQSAKQGSILITNELINSQSLMSEIIMLHSLIAAKDIEIEKLQEEQKKLNAIIRNHNTELKR